MGGRSIEAIVHREAAAKNPFRVYYYRSRFFLNLVGTVFLTRGYAEWVFSPHFGEVNVAWRSITTPWDSVDDAMLTAVPYFLGTRENDTDDQAIHESITSKCPRIEFN